MKAMVLTAFFMTAFTDLSAPSSGGWGNGGMVVDNQIAMGADHGTEPRPFAIFAHSSGVTKCEGGVICGHTGVVLGIDGDKLSRYPSNLSGGEQQRVAIGRTLATGAKVILADEPTGNLDDENSDRIIDILKQLAHDQGFCVIIVTHDMEIAEESDHVWRIKDGTIENVK